MVPESVTEDLSLPEIPPEADALPQDVIFDAEIIYLEGDVGLVSSGREVVPEPGLIMKAGDSVFTGSDGLCEIDLGRLGRVYIKEDTVFDLNTLNLLESSPRAGLEVVSGLVILKLKKLADNEALAIKGESVICGVRGTTFMVQTGPEKDRIGVLNGSVSLLPENLDFTDEVPDSRRRAEIENEVRNVGFSLEAGQEISVAPEDMATLKKDAEILKSVLVKSDDKDLITQNLSFFSSRLDSANLKREPLGDDFRQMMNNPHEKTIPKTIVSDSPQEVFTDPVVSGGGIPDPVRTESGLLLRPVNGTLLVSEKEITFSLFDRFCRETGKTPPSDAGWGRGERPVINVSWNDSVEFCNWLSRREGMIPAYNRTENQYVLNSSSGGYRLPTESEWLLSADNGEISPLTAWYSENSRGRTQETGRRRANSLGLYDMSGNVWEWCWDSADPELWKQKNLRVIKGGSWKDSSGMLDPGISNASAEDKGYYLLGFRVVRSL